MPGVFLAWKLGFGIGDFELQVLTVRLLKNRNIATYLHTAMAITIVSLIKAMAMLSKIVYMLQIMLQALTTIVMLFMLLLLVLLLQMRVR